MVEGVPESVVVATMNPARFAVILLRTLAPTDTMAMGIDYVQVLFLLCVVGIHVIALVLVLNTLMVH